MVIVCIPNNYAPFDTGVFIPHTPRIVFTLLIVVVGLKNRSDLHCNSEGASLLYLRIMDTSIEADLGGEPRRFLHLTLHLTHRAEDDEEGESGEGRAEDEEEEALGSKTPVVNQDSKRHGRPN